MILIGLVTLKPLYALEDLCPLIAIDQVKKEKNNFEKYFTSVVYSTSVSIFFLYLFCRFTGFQIHTNICKNVVTRIKNMMNVVHAMGNKLGVKLYGHNTDIELMD